MFMAIPVKIICERWNTNLFIFFLLVSGLEALIQFFSSHRFQNFFFFRWGLQINGVPHLTDNLHWISLYHTIYIGEGKKCTRRVIYAHVVFISCLLDIYFLFLDVQFLKKIFYLDQGYLEKLMDTLTDRQKRILLIDYTTHCVTKIS